MNCSSRALAGCKIGRFNFCARIFTGENCNFKSRPLGLSGCVTTAAMEKYLSLASFSKLAQDNSAVPMKIIFISGCSPTIVIHKLKIIKKLLARYRLTVNLCAGISQLPELFYESTKQVDVSGGDFVFSNCSRKHFCK